METIVAIGSGEILYKETLEIDRKIVELSGKENPNVLFVPTASGDAFGYWETFDKLYSELGCNCSALFLLNEEQSAEDIQTKILSADIVYVGGGNTRRMLDKWRELGVDQILKEALTKGIILSGLSAGANCWFEYASSDADKMEKGNQSKLILIEGLGFIKGLCSPHHIRESYRNEELPGIIGQVGDEALVSYAIDDNAALIYQGEEISTISSNENSHVRKVYFKDGKLVWEIL